MQRVSSYLYSLFIILIGIFIVLINILLVIICIILLFWFFAAGGWLAILKTLVTTAELSFQHDWKLAEVVLVLLILFLVVRKR